MWVMRAVDFGERVVWIERRMAVFAGKSESCTAVKLWRGRFIFIVLDLTSTRGACHLFL